jgi:hypothetical protein
MRAIACIDQRLDSIAWKFEDEFAPDEHGEDLSVHLQLPSRAESLAFADARRAGTGQDGFHQ